MRTVLGIDIGGSGIKGAPVDLEQGRFAAERVRVPTPDGAPPGPVADVVAQVVSSFDTRGPVGRNFPGVVGEGVGGTGAKGRQGGNGNRRHGPPPKQDGRGAVVNNGRDAGGVGEVRYGAGRHRDGKIVVLNLG